PYLTARKAARAEKSIAVRRQRRAQRAPSSCSPPPEVATDCTALRAVTIQPNSRPRVGLTAAPLSLRRVRARAEILLEQFTIVLTISFSSGRTPGHFSRRPLGFHLDFALRKMSEIPL
ncbi:hypothetical protein, partial [uncultured Rikenella sp.]|uniref:hypothetical protein n=1 Tax=uncultured Rikenella sp. TaxID=368003 RepID=UPI0025DA1030